MGITAVAVLATLVFVILGKAASILPLGLIVAAALFQLFLLLLILLQAFKSLGKADRKIATGIVSIARRDLVLNIVLLGVCGIAMLQLFLGAAGYCFAFLHLIFFALSLDLLLIFSRRAFSFSILEGLLDQFGLQVEKELKLRNSEGALNWCAAIYQVGASGIRDHNALQSSAAFNALFLSTEQLISWAPFAALYSERYRKNADLTLIESLQIFIIFIAQRALWLIQDALNVKLQPAAQQGISFFGRVSCFLVTKHPEIAHVPMIELMTSVQEFSDEQLRVLDVHIALTASEVMKTMLQEANEQKRLLREPLLHVMRLLEVHMQGSYQRRRKQNVALFMQPFAEFGQMLADPGIASLEGISQVKEELQRLFMQFSTLETIESGMFTSGAEGAKATDSSATFAQDLPYLKK